MKNYITLFFFALLIGISCSKEKTIEDDLVGEWVYERETFISGSTFEDLDTRGVMTFNKDETGTWVSDNGFNFSNEIEWDLQRMDSKISITKIPPPEFSNFSISQIYELKQNGDNEFVFTFEFYLTTLDTVPTLQRFENIILTRK